MGRECESIAWSFQGSPHFRILGCGVGPVHTLWVSKHSMRLRRARVVTPRTCNLDLRGPEADSVCRIRRGRSWAVPDCEQPKLLENFRNNSTAADKHSARIILESVTRHETVTGSERSLHVQDCFLCPMVVGALLHWPQAAFAAYPEAAHAFPACRRDRPVNCSSIETRNRPHDSHPAHAGYHQPRLWSGHELLLR